MTFRAYLLLFIYLILLTGKLGSQVIGTKFAPDSSYWKENGSWITGGGPGNLTYTYGYSNKYIHGDTIVNNKYYQKLFITNRPEFDTICLGSLNLIHYNNQKLYLNNNRIYDFSLNLGDTINIYYNWTPNHPAGYFTYTVSVCDSVYIGKWRKRLNLVRPPNTFVINNIKWVEGIGDINYGFNASYYSLEIILPIGYWKLNCFSEHFQNTYGIGCGLNTMCGLVNNASNMACNATSSNINFKIYSGIPPFTFTIQPPPSCASTYTAISTATATTFSLNCPGIYTINLKDSNNSNLGIVTHSVSLDSTINIVVSTAQDTICDNQSTTLSVVSTGSNYTIYPINWSNGGNGSAITVTPTITTTYSVNGLYTTVASRTCTAKGSKLINVISCVGIMELNEADNLLFFPNPSKNQINFLVKSELVIHEILLLTIDGKKIEINIENNTINFGDISEGVYYLDIKTNKGKTSKKIIITQ